MTSSLDDPLNPAPQTGAVEYRRKVNLLVTNADGKTALDLSELHIKFNIRAWTNETGNCADIRVYNLDQAHAKQLEHEYSGVILSAGYEGGEFATIFDGTIIQVRNGQHETPADRYCDISAIEGDIALSYAIIKTSIGNGSTYAQRLDILAKALGYTTPTLPDPLPDDVQGLLPRGRAMFGKASDEMRDLAMHANSNWSIQGGELRLIAYNGYLQKQLVEINAATGMIGYPEHTEEGVRVKCLLNPSLLNNMRIRLNNKDITDLALALDRSTLAQNIPVISRSLIASDGLYRIIVLEHSGDTRGQEWYSDMVCIAIEEGPVQRESLISMGRTG